MSLLRVPSRAVQQLGAIAILSPLAFAYAIIFIDPSRRLQRASIVFLSVAFAAKLQSDVPIFTGNGTYDGFLMSIVWMFHLRAFDVLLWRAVHLDHATVITLQQSQPYAPRSPSSKLYTAWCLLFNFRNISTPWAVKGIPAFSTRDPKYAPSRRTFVKTRLTNIITTYLILDALFAFLPPPNAEIDIPEAKQALFSRLGSVTLEEILTRPFGVLLPAFSIYGIFTIPYNITAVVAVLLNTSSPQHWPPLFGSFKDAYTLRRFWGLSWHQLFRSFLEATTSSISTIILRISPERHRLLFRCVCLCLAFYISALVHLPGSVVLGISLFATGSPTFFLMQAVGIIVESFVLHLWGAKKGGEMGTESEKTSEAVTSGNVGRLLGYAWVGAWLVWTAPGFTWVTARALDPERDAVVPWSLFGWMGFGK